MHLTRLLPWGAVAKLQEGIQMPAMSSSSRSGSCRPAGNMCCHMPAGSVHVLMLRYCSLLLAVRAEKADAGGLPMAARMLFCRSKNVSCCRCCSSDSSCAALAAPPGRFLTPKRRCCSSVLSASTPVVQGSLHSVGWVPARFAIYPGYSGCHIVVGALCLPAKHTVKGKVQDNELTEACNQ
jgi:hypothetical protein